MQGPVHAPAVVLHPSRAPVMPRALRAAEPRPIKHVSAGGGVVDAKVMVSVVRNRVLGEVQTARRSAAERIWAGAAAPGSRAVALQRRVQAAELPPLAIRRCVVVPVLHHFGIRCHRHGILRVVHGPRTLRDKRGMTSTTPVDAAIPAPDEELAVVDLVRVLQGREGQQQRLHLPGRQAEAQTLRVLQHVGKLEAPHRAHADPVQIQEAPPGLHLAASEGILDALAHALGFRGRPAQCPAEGREVHPKLVGAAEGHLEQLRLGLVELGENADIFAKHFEEDRERQQVGKRRATQLRPVALLPDGVLRLAEEQLHEVEAQAVGAGHAGAGVPPLGLAPNGLADLHHHSAKRHVAGDIGVSR
eukprot:scaffold2786_cov202-Pinguiococcus_pyrenoidosus.AAC.1